MSVRRTRAHAVVAVAVAALAVGATAAASNVGPGAGTTTRASVSSSGQQADSSSQGVATSGDGHFVVFDSEATNLVAGDSNARRDVFVHDVATGATTRISVSSSGAQGNADSQWPSISGDGRYVGFHSYASNLVGGDTNGQGDSFVHDRQTGVTTRVSVASSGAQASLGGGIPSISPDGRYVAFTTGSKLVTADTNNSGDVYVHDRQTAATTLESVSSGGAVGNGNSLSASIASGGRYVVFESWATNFVSGDTNGFVDVFLRDRVASTLTRVSVSAAGLQANGTSGSAVISADGKWIAYQSAATNLVTGDTNGFRDAFVRNRSTGATTIASVDGCGTQAGADSWSPSISADGRHVAFHTTAELAPPDLNSRYDVYVRDRTDGTTTIASVSSAGAQGVEAHSFEAGVADDGLTVAFLSDALLTLDDTNMLRDAYVRVLDPSGGVPVPDLPC
jgi:Tol biopolymer transport system component